ncbi:MAG TPA: hypothetical protein VFX59_12735 [Polyangiales bacterium]|nr:hypothetical protein [Polyangiales bacterium]
MRDERNPVRWRRTRLGLYLAAIATLSTVWVAHKADAEVSERALSIGRELDRFGAIAAGTTTFELNGARMALTTLVRKESPKVLLDRFAGLCARDSGGVAEQLDSLKEKIPDGLRSGQFGVFRSEQGKEATAACFARQEGGGLEETVRRLNLLVDSGDFAALGQLRYMFVRDLGNGESHVLSVSSLGALPLDRMFPEQSDAPGKDLSFDVRPAGARRLMSAGVEGSKLEGAIYESTLPPEQALAGYDAPMQKLGFSRGSLDGVASSLIAGARVFLRHDETVLVFAEPRDDHSTVSSFRLANGGFVTVRGM